MQKDKELIKIALGNASVFVFGMIKMKRLKFLSNLVNLLLLIYGLDRNYIFNKLFHIFIKLRIIHIK